MRRRATQAAHITPTGGNVFLDLGFPPEEAKAMKAESDRRIAAQQTWKIGAHMDLCRRADEVLHYVWDPIGIAQFPAARDKYHAYLPHVVSLLEEGVSIQDLAAYLHDVALVQMEVTVAWTHSEAVAELLCAWRAALAARD